MTNFSIKDYGLSAEQLLEKYGDDSDHPAYLRGQWRSAVGFGDTELGYWDWVRHRLIEEEEELEKDSPYNQGIFE